MSRTAVLVAFLAFAAPAAAARVIVADPALTPGVRSIHVTQGNIKSTICLSGYTRTVRPPVTPASGAGNWLLLVAVPNEAFGR